MAQLRAVSPWQLTAWVLACGAVRHHAYLHEDSDGEPQHMRRCSQLRFACGNEQGHGRFLSPPALNATETNHVCAARLAVPSTACHTSPSLWLPHTS